MPALMINATAVNITNTVTSSLHPQNMAPHLPVLPPSELHHHQSPKDIAHDPDGYIGKMVDKYERDPVKRRAVSPGNNKKRFVSGGNTANEMRVKFQSKLHDKKGQYGTSSAYTLQIQERSISISRLLDPPFSWLITIMACMGQFLLNHSKDCDKHKWDLQYVKGQDSEMYLCMNSSGGLYLRNETEKREDDTECVFYVKNETDNEDNVIYSWAYPKKKGRCKKKRNENITRCKKRWFVSVISDRKDSSKTNKFVGVTKRMNPKVNAVFISTPDKSGGGAGGMDSVHLPIGQPPTTSQKPYTPARAAFEIGKQKPKKTKTDKSTNLLSSVGLHQNIRHGRNKSKRKGRKNGSPPFELG